MDGAVKRISLWLLLGLLLGFAAAYPSFVITYVLEPIASMLWAAWRVIASVHQAAWWTLLVILCIVLIVRVLLYERGNPATPDRDSQYETPARVERWQVLFRDAAQGSGNEALRESLAALLTAVAEQEGRSSADPQRALASTRFPWPPAARRYLLGGVAERSEVPEKHRLILARVLRWLRQTLGRSAASERTAIHELLEWMETAMEIRHDQ